MQENNIISIHLDEILRYIQVNVAGDSLDWGTELSLHKHSYRIISIDIWNQKVGDVGYARWGWKGDEMKFHKVEVEPEYQKQGIGSILMQMVIAIAKYFKATKITSTIAGDDFLDGWYEELGFTIYNQNKIVLELNK